MKALIQHFCCSRLHVVRAIEPIRAFIYNNQEENNIFDRKTRLMTIAAVIICIAAFTYTGKLHATEQPVQTQSVAVMDTKMSTVKLIETPRAENYIININDQVSNKADNNLLAK